MNDEPEIARHTAAAPLAASADHQYHFRMEPTVPIEVTDYLSALSDGTLEQVLPVFKAIQRAMPDGYELGLHFGMPGWVVPLSTFPDTYNKKPLSFVSLAAGKRYNSIYLMGLYSDSRRDAEFRAAWAETGLSLDMGKSCLRYQRLVQLDLDLIELHIASLSVRSLIESYESAKA